MTIADLVFIFSGILMVDNVYGFIRPAFSNANDYVTYLYNKWVVLLLIAAILEIYTMHRIEWEISIQRKEHAELRKKYKSYIISIK